MAPSSPRWKGHIRAKDLIWTPGLGCSSHCHVLQGSKNVPGLGLRDHGGHCQDNWWGPGRQHCGQEHVTVITEEPHIPGEEG